MASDAAAPNVSNAIRLDEGAAAALLTGLPLLVPARDKITVKRRISSGSLPNSCGRGRLGR